MTLLTILKETSTKELLRAIKSNKNYCYFKISVFNVGTQITIVNTDTYKDINPNTWNGYDFILENDYTTKYYISKELENRELTKNQKRGLIYYN